MTPFSVMLSTISDWIPQSDLFKPMYHYPTDRGKPSGVAKSKRISKKRKNIKARKKK